MALEKAEKEIITHQIIAERLIRRGRRDFFILLLALIFGGGFLWIGVSLYEIQFEAQKLVKLLCKVCLIVMGCWVVFKDIRQAFRRWRAGITGAFTVSGDTLVSAQQRRLPFYRSARFVREELVITFVSGLVYRERIHSMRGVEDVGMRLKYTVSASNPGDLFHVVTIDREPGTPIYLFPDELFAYEEK